MRSMLSHIQIQCRYVTLVLGLLVLLMPLHGVAQEATPAELMPVVAAPGGLQIVLAGSNGMALSGAFAVTDAAGVYHDLWVESGAGTVGDLLPGQAAVTQASGTTDYGFDASAIQYVTIPAGDIAALSIVNTFLDVDADGVGDSADICAAGNDAIDTDADGTADACDSTPNGDTDGDGVDNLSDTTPNGDTDGDGVDNVAGTTPNGDTDSDGVDNAVDACPAGDDAADMDADGTADACDSTPIVNTDSVQLDGEATRTTNPGEQVTVSFTYAVTTPRLGTTVHAALVDEVGGTPDGWSLSTSKISDVSALKPDTTFATTVTVTAPRFVEIPHAVSLQVWSEAITETGVESGVQPQAIATMTVAAPAARPTIVCEPGVVETIVCTLSADRPDVVGGRLTVTGDPVGSFSVNGSALPASGIVDLSTVLPDGALSGVVTIARGVGAGCADPAQPHMVTIAVDYTYSHVPAAHAETGVVLELAASEPVIPTVTVAPLDFGTLTWDGSSWGAAEATTTVTVSREGCSDLGAFDIQVEFVGDIPGFRPELTSVSTVDGNVTLLATTGDPNVGPRAVARVSEGFTGTVELVLVFRLTPDADALVGTHHLEMHVATVTPP